MSAAGTAGHFHSAHAVAAIGVPGYAIFGHDIPEARPARTRIVFGIGCEQRAAAANAVIDTLFFAIGIFSGKGRLGAF